MAVITSGATVAGVAPARSGRRRRSTHSCGSVVPSKPNAGLLSSSTSDRTTSGCASARCWAIIPPIDSPSTWLGAAPVERSHPAAASARAAKVMAGSGVLAP